MDLNRTGWSLPARGGAIGVLLTSMLLAGCASPSTRQAAPTPETARTEVALAGGTTISPDDAVTRVLAISVDGLNPDAITELGRAGAPNLHRMMREGAYTLNARTEVEKTQTLPNHTGMLTGRRVEASQDGHGVDFNTDIGRTVHTAAGEYVASVFDVVHDGDGRTALYTTKDKFAIYDRTWSSTHGAPDRYGTDQGRDKIDRFVYDSDHTTLVNRFRNDLTSSPSRFALLHLSLPDRAGHEDGFMSREYLAAVRQTDTQVGRILDTVRNDSYLRQHLLVALTSDHGGLPGSTSHSDVTRAANYTIPFVVWGPGVAAERDLYSLNPERVRPGTSRPGYSGPQPIRNGEIANLATDVLDLPEVPGSEFDVPRTLNVFPG